MATPFRTLTSLLGRITSIGVDPTRPRSETKHVAVVNAVTLVYSLALMASVFGPMFHTLLPPIRIVLAVSTALVPAAIIANARGWHLAAALWNVFFTQAIFFYIGLREPEESHHELFLAMSAIVSYFVFPPSRRIWSVAATLSALVGSIYLMTSLHGHPPPQLPEYDAFQIGFGNRIMFFILVIAAASYAAREMARVERELVAERARSEALLKNEVSHQVAARSRELGQILSRIESAMVVDRLAPGDRFDTRYVVSRELGAGGMGAVYEVERVTDGQHLALKVVTGEVSASHAARFAQEAEIGARIHHRNLVAIVDVGVASGGVPFLVMELARGGSLEDQRARFGDATWALPIIRQIAAGLFALHEADVVHRDLKPANVLFASDGVAKISDFGISRFGAIDSSLDVDPTAATVRPSGAGVRAPGLTATGALLGTPFYMAPEAARGGRAVGSAADVFAFGIIACEMLTGRPPFEIPPVFASMVNERVTEPNVDLRGVDSATRDVIRACLSMQPDQRPSMRDVCAAFGVSARDGDAAA